MHGLSLKVTDFPMNDCRAADFLVNFPQQRLLFGLACLQFAPEAGPELLLLFTHHQEFTITDNHRSSFVYDLHAFILIEAPRGVEPLTPSLGRRRSVR